MLQTVIWRVSTLTGYVVSEESFISEGSEVGDMCVCVWVAFIHSQLSGALFSFTKFMLKVEEVYLDMV